MLNYIYLIPIILFAGSIPLTFFTKFPAFIFLAIFGFLYMIFIPRVSKIAQAGNRALAIKTGISAFVPLIGTANSLIYKIAENKIFKHYVTAAKEGSRMFEGWLTELFPEYGSLIYSILITVIIVGVNLIAIKTFIDLMRKLLFVPDPTQKSATQS